MPRGDLILTRGTTPTKDEKIIFKDCLLDLLKDAIKIELSTIPLYIFSTYSINLQKDDEHHRGADARTRILVVVQQEMLHLALVGNLITAIDSGPKLYAKDVVPTYGGPDDTILSSDIPLKLERCEKSNLELFLRIEAPYEAPVDLHDTEELPDGDLMATTAASLAAPVYKIAENYKSIGQFYRDVEEMIKACADYITFGNKEKQFSGAEFFEDLMVQIKDQPSAYQALKTIIDQGEGSVGVEEAHYQMFLDLYKKRTQWTTWPVIESPKGSMYTDFPFINSLSNAFNAAYCYLLVSIEKTWQTSDPIIRRSLIGNMHAIMIDIMSPLALVLVQQPIDRRNGQQENAAPTFEFYPTTEGADTDQAAQELFEAIIWWLDQALQRPGGEWNEALKLVKFAVTRVSWRGPIVLK